MGTIKNKTYVKNRKSYHDYEMLSSYEAGMKLTGAQVKSIRNGNINLLGSYASIEEDGVFLKQCHISKPDHIGYNGRSFDEKASIPLLLHKSEIQKILKEVQEKSKTLIVTEVYQREGTGTIKCKLNIAKGKRDYDKREALKRKQADIDSKRQMKDY
jgi:SsrA-binding protein